MSGPRIVPSEVTGAELAELVKAAAAKQGISATAFVRNSGLSSQGVAWLGQLINSRTPHARTIDRVQRACAGEVLCSVPVTAPRKKPWRPVKDGAEAMPSPERLEALRASSEVRARIAKVGLGAGAATGREILISADLWRRVVAEADACGRAPASMLIEAVEMGLLASAEERLEREREIAA